MLSRARKACVVTAVLLGALTTPVALATSARADPDDCLRYLESVTDITTLSGARLACEEPFLRGAAGVRSCVSILRADGLQGMVLYEACRRGAPPTSDCPLTGVDFDLIPLPDGSFLEIRDAELISATTASCTYAGDGFIRSRTGVAVAIGRTLRVIARF